jgi:hypothetical protein
MVRERGPDLAGRAVIFPIQIEKGEVGEQQAQGFEIEVDLPASVGAVIKLVRDDGGNSLGVPAPGPRRAAVRHPTGGSAAR